MQRIPESELMNEAQQARAYAKADFSEPNQLFLQLLEECLGGRSLSGYLLDLGCGPGHITLHLAERYPDCIVHGLDGARQMLKFGRQTLLEKPELAGRIEFIEQTLPATSLSCGSYDAIVSNSLLHHLHDPSVLWDTVKRYSKPGAAVLVMDLIRPADQHSARALVDHYAGDEPEVLKRDFFNSLLAAFEPSEIEAQLQEAGLHHLCVRAVSDRHVLISGLVAQ